MAQELQIPLRTTSSLPSIYISRIQTGETVWDWRYFEELRAVLEFDLSAGGYVTAIPNQAALEEALHFPSVTKEFAPLFWQQENIPFVIALSTANSKLIPTVFNVAKKSFKEYPPLTLTGVLDQDRRQMHRLSDLLHKDLFHAKGIASLKILYSKREKNFSSPEDLQYLSEIYLCDFDGANDQRVTFQNGYSMSPGVLPSTHNDLSFYYVFYHEGQSKIYRSSLSTPQTEPLVRLRGNQALPTFSKKSHLMAFVSDAAGRPDLFLQAFDHQGHLKGRARQIFSAPRATQASPTFSPDGTKIAFVSDKDGTPKIYVMQTPDLQTTKIPRPYLLTQKNRENSCPAWSPDGTKLAYSARVDGVRQIWLYDFETKEEIQLTSGPYAKENPSWAPDSLHLLYNTESNEYAEIYLLHIHHPAPLLLSKGTGLKRFACFVE